MSEHGSTQDDDAPEAGREDPEAAHPRADANLSDLRARLDELQDSIALLGSQASWPLADEVDLTPSQQAPPPPTPPQQPPPSPPAFSTPAATPYEPSPFEPPSYEPPPSQPYGYGYEVPPPAPYEPPQPAPYPAPGPPPPPPWQPPAEPDALTYPAPPAATNGHAEESVDPAEISARSATVAIVDAGPFADLIDLRHFEDELAALAAVRDVRVRRFGQGRANIEVGMTGPYALSRELPHLNRPMEIGDGPDGEVLIELAPLTDREEEPELEYQTTDREDET